MRILAPLLKASIVAALVFAVAWLRIPRFTSSLERVFGIFVVYGLLIAIVSLAIGFPVASILVRYRMVRRWSSTTVGAAVGALLAGTFTYRPSRSPAIFPSTSDTSQMNEVENPFALTFSPWNRDVPGFTEGAPFSQADFVGSVVFGAIVGGVLGFAFWYFYSHGRTAHRR